LKSLIPVGSERGVTRSASNPFSALQQEIDRLFEGFSRGLSGFPAREMMPSVDLSGTDKEIEITAELPGLEEKDIQLNVADNVLTIRGEACASSKQEDRYQSGSLNAHGKCAASLGSALSN
jgi:HSP20 family protein